MTAITRSIDAGTPAVIAEQHTQPFHIVRLTLASETVYLSEGPEVTFNTNVYVEGRVKVTNLTWTGDGSQTCTLEIFNEDNYAATLFLQNQISDAGVDIWTVHRKADGTFTVPDLYVIGTVDDSELTVEVLRLTIATSRYRTRFFPSVYMGTAGFNHMPAEGTIVFWNSTTYELERNYG